MELRSIRWNCSMRKRTIDKLVDICFIALIMFVYTKWSLTWCALLFTFHFPNSQKFLKFDFMLIP
jgi:hypothetical protein